ncbi:hypothetical protein [Fluoribacter gormanii]|uniref:hypothetical protein n=1 Tax=Fluoribacter gormanii TaxID=464 RepID=UPI0013EF7421|nr:hypothetical protein [Fluoribacter gormanii]
MNSHEEKINSKSPSLFASSVKKIIVGLAIREFISHKQGYCLINWLGLRHA